MHASNIRIWPNTPTTPTTKDKIVPPNQAELMYAAVKDQGLPCALKIYEGEQHGFRRLLAEILSL